ncbi:hypothetical protein [uncultured Shimia sp.]|uniref:hypothetical protein n=1 Tax=uncultured Shimia sp. TaxID=573152 RepID=UPI002633F0FD|nr:hypothetical protein [uncultured Shimia sp.]
MSVDTIVAQLRAAAAGKTPIKDVRTIVETLVADPERAANTFGDPGEDVILFEDETVSIWYCHFHPGMSVPAHDHQVSGTIGVFRGRERNDFFEADPSGGLRKSSDVFLGPGDTLSFGPSAIHSVSCVSETPCNGLHVYLGPLTTVERTLFDIDKGAEMPFDDENYDRLMASDRFTA